MIYKLNYLLILKLKLQELQYLLEQLYLLYNVILSVTMFTNKILQNDKISLFLIHYHSQE